MRSFVIALAMGLAGVDVANAACSGLTDWVGIVGLSADPAGAALNACVDGATTLAANTACDIKATAGYTVTGTLQNSCDAGIVKTQATAKVVGCAKGYYQSTAATTAGGETAGAATVGVCSACPAGKTTAAAVTFLIAGGTAYDAKNTEGEACIGFCSVTDINAMAGISQIASPAQPQCAGTFVASNSECDYEAATGYTVTGTLKTVCGAGTTTTSEASVTVSGCADGWYQDGANVAEAANTAATATCAQCPNGKWTNTVHNAAFLAAGQPFDNQKTEAAACFGCAITDLSAKTGIQQQAAGICAGAALGTGGTCTYTAATGYTIGTTGLTSVCGTGTTAADQTPTTQASIKVTGCAAGYYQSTAATTAGGEAAGVDAVGRCTVCANGKTSAAAEFLASGTAFTAIGAGTTCTPCPAGTMGTAGTCNIGCPADSYQSNTASPWVSTTSASITCAACDATAYKGLEAASGLANGAETQAANCGAKGCRLNYNQVGGSSTIATSCVETAIKAATCVAINGIDEKRCAAVTDGVLASCDAVFQLATTTPFAATTTKACTYTALVAAASPAVTCTGTTAALCAASGACTFTAEISATAAVDASDAVCAKCPAGKVIPAANVGNVVPTVCLGCNPYTAGDCTNGCPANFWQHAGTSVAGAGILCTACADGKVLANEAPLATIQTAAACTVPVVAAASSAVSATASVATAVAAALAAAATLA